MKWSWIFRSSITTKSKMMPSKDKTTYIKLTKNFMEQDCVFRYFRNKRGIIRICMLVFILSTAFVSDQN